MLEVKDASFSFEDFKVPYFRFQEPSEVNSNLKIGFNPSGVFYSENSRYDLSLNIVVHDEKNPDNIIFEVTSISRFRFDSLDSFESIPPYFYKNAIAIVFPYLRAFMSTLTLQANTRLIRLGLMNLSNLEQPLKDNTTII